MKIKTIGGIALKMSEIAVNVSLTDFGPKILPRANRSPTAKPNAIDARKRDTVSSTPCRMYAKAS